MNDQRRVWRWLEQGSPLAGSVKSWRGGRKKWIYVCARMNDVVRDEEGRDYSIVTQTGYLMNKKTYFWVMLHLHGLRQASASSGTETFHPHCSLFKANYGCCCPSYIRICLCSLSKWCRWHMSRLSYHNLLVVLVTSNHRSLPIRASSAVTHKSTCGDISPDVFLYLRLALVLILNMMKVFVENTCIKYFWGNYVENWRLRVSCFLLLSTMSWCRERGNFFSIDWCK